MNRWNTTESRTWKGMWNFIVCESYIKRILTILTMLYIRYKNMLDVLKTILRGKLIGLKYYNKKITKDWTHLEKDFRKAGE